MELRQDPRKKNAQLLVMGAKPEPEKTEKRGADTGPGLIVKWRRRAKIGQRRDPGMAGIGRIRDRC